MWGSGAGNAGFKGWYFKQQNGADTIAFIPAFHTDKKRGRSASLQVITGADACFVQYRAEDCFAQKGGLQVRLGNCAFSDEGCRLDIVTEEFSVSGALKFGPLQPPARDVMGPLRFLPFMECRHSVYSLFHKVDGRLLVNGREMTFKNGLGYIEGDSGSSFPNRYVWTQWGKEENCIFLSAAQIPFCGRSFTGCTGIVYWEKKEHRIASYLGAKIASVTGDAVVIRQGELTLLAQLQDSGFQTLRAPVVGMMTRSVHENAACSVRYRCTLRGQVLFDFVAEDASYENNWQS
jgi:tocopherol cyclase